MVSEMFAKLVDIFPDTISTLVIQTCGFFGIDARVIEAVGRMPTLRRLLLEDERSERQEYEFPRSVHEPFDSLMLAAKGLTYLRLELPVYIPLYIPLTAPPTVTFLEIEVTSIRSDMAMSLAKALKPSLLVLSIQHKKAGKPVAKFFALVYEILQDTLQGLSVPNEKWVTDRMLRPKFTKLRILKIDDLSLDSFENKNWNMFPHAPIEMIATNCPVFKWHRRGPPFHINSFSNLPSLREFVLMGAPRGYRPPAVFITACRAAGVRPVLVNHMSTPHIMVI
jgi:hypothetical protein